MFNQVVEIIKDQLGIEDREITPETSLMKDLEADSLDAVEIIMALEDEFSVEIPDTEAKYIEANK